MNEQRQQLPRFIVIEGIDGSGTTTQTKRLAERMRLEGRAVITTCEPTSGPIGKLLRLALQGGLGREPAIHAELDWATMALLFAADRTDHVTSQIAPALSQGTTVICDRYDLSSRIYQSLTAPQANLALPWICQINSQVPRPDITFVLAVDVTLAAQRRQERSETTELYEGLALQRELARAYGDAQRYVPNDRLSYVPGDLSVPEVTERLYRACCDPEK